jgi:hypothetical protein
MHSSSKCLAVTAFLIFTMSQVAFSQDKSIVPLGSGGRKVGLVIGNSSYSTGSLTNPVKDAVAMRKALRAKGFLVSECCDNLGIQKMTSVIDDWTKNLQKDDVAVFYYSGHGIRVEGTDYLVPSDFSSSYSQADVPFFAYSVDRLQGKMHERGTRTNLIILDACRDNPFIISKSLGKGLAGMAAGFGTFIIYSASPGMTASDNATSTNSLFTSVLLQFLSQDSVSLRALATDVKDRVYELSGQTQIPYISENMVGDLQLKAASQSSTDFLGSKPKVISGQEGAAANRSNADDSSGTRPAPSPSAKLFALQATIPWAKSNILGGTQTIRGECQGDSFTAHVRVGSDWRSLSDPFTCDTATINYMGQSSGLIRIKFNDSQSHKEVPATGIEFSGSMEPDGRTIKITVFYYEGPPALKVSNASCNLSGDPLQIYCSAFYSGGAIFAGTVHFSAISNQLGLGGDSPSKIEVPVKGTTKAVANAHSSLREAAWLSADLLGHYHENTVSVPVSIRPMNEGSPESYKLDIEATQAHLICNLTFGQSGDPKSVSDCVFADDKSEWQVTNIAPFECADRKSYEVCQAAYTLHYRRNDTYEGEAVPPERRVMRVARPLTP